MRFYFCLFDAWEEKSLLINAYKYHVQGTEISIRSAVEADAKSLAKVRVEIDGETEYLDREAGEDYIDEQGFRQLIKDDQVKLNHLFLVAEISGTIVGFSRCDGNSLKRTAHKVSFGVCVLQAFWGLGIGQQLLEQSVQWADANGIMKMVLQVLEVNRKALNIYQKYGFKVEGILERDKYLADGKYYNTLVMARFREPHSCNSGR